MLDDPIIGQEADIGTAYVGLQLELIDSRSLNAAAAMRHQDDREHCRRRTYRYRGPTESWHSEHGRSQSSWRVSRFRTRGKQFASQIGAVRHPIG
jgi:hypothetical protein